MSKAAPFCGRTARPMTTVLAAGALTTPTCISTLMVPGGRGAVRVRANRVVFVSAGCTTPNTTAPKVPAAPATKHRSRASEAARLWAPGRRQITIASTLQVATLASKHTVPRGTQTAGPSTAASGVAAMALRHGNRNHSVMTACILGHSSERIEGYCLLSCLLCPEGSRDSIKSVRQVNV